MVRISILMLFFYFDIGMLYKVIVRTIKKRIYVHAISLKAGLNCIPFTTARLLCVLGKGLML
ncbi:MAG: hypothetical protein EXX96DRAFT_583051 [Benjaminiella poitrasii]|nr:MAG: hypothetical protein EXX96DRAFT_583051 [Benjaminiella poitrasii]